MEIFNYRTAMNHSSIQHHIKASCQCPVYHLFHLGHPDDKEDHFPFLSRNKTGHWEFTKSDLEWVRLVCCLKNTGKKIKEHKKYIDYVRKGKKRKFAPNTRAGAKYLFERKLDIKYLHNTKPKENLFPKFKPFLD